MQIRIVGGNTQGGERLGPPYAAVMRIGNKMLRKVTFMAALASWGVLSVILLTSLALGETCIQMKF